MAISYPVDIEPLQDAGVSNATIAEHLSDRTAEPIANSDARAQLQESGAVVIDPAMPSRRSGSLINFYEGLPAGEQTATLVAWFINAVFGTADDIGTDDYPRSIQFAQVEGILPGDLQPVAAGIVADAGGRPDNGTTEADVIAIQAAYEQAQNASRLTADQQNKFDGLVNQHIAPLVAANVYENAIWQTAVDAIASDWGEA